MPLSNLRCRNEASQWKRYSNRQRRIPHFLAATAAGGCPHRPAHWRSRKGNPVMTEADMIEAMARAIYERVNGYGCRPWRQIDHKPAYRDQATAALAVVQPELDRLRAENGPSEITAGTSAGAKQPDPDWFWCDIDPDESGDSAYQAMHSYRPRLEPVELGTSYAGPKLWGVMSPPLPDADNDEDTAHTFDTREAAQAFCDERNAIFNGAALCPSEGGDRG